MSEEMSFSEYLDLLPDQRGVGYAVLLSATESAVEVDRDERGPCWFTGDGGDLYAAKNEDAKPEHVAGSALEKLLRSQDCTVIDRAEVPAFREFGGDGGE